MELIQKHYYWFDLAIGLGSPLLLLVLLRLGRLSERSLAQFWLGAAVGLLWEAPLFIGSYATESLTTIALNRPFPLPWPVFLVIHTLWDGLLFVVGCWLIQLVFGPRAWRRPSAGPLLLFVLYGQLQAVAVEWSSLASGAWYYLDLSWNPWIVSAAGRGLTPLPQLFWLAGSVGFFFIWRRLDARRENNF